MSLSSLLAIKYIFTTLPCPPGLSPDRLPAPKRVMLKLGLVVVIVIRLCTEISPLADLQPEPVAHLATCLPDASEKNECRFVAFLPPNTHL
jgi:hypothetical protein